MENDVIIRILIVYFMVLYLFSNNIVSAADERQSLTNCLIEEAMHQSSKALPKMYCY